MILPEESSKMPSGSMHMSEVIKATSINNNLLYSPPDKINQ